MINDNLESKKGKRSMKIDNWRSKNGGVNHQK
jgi:hypothetical protein